MTRQNQRSASRDSGLGARWIIGVVFALTIASISACSTIRLGYGQAPTLMYHWLDNWVDFDDAQAPKAREALEALHKWHRRTQLPDYAQWLSSRGPRMERDATADDACTFASEAEERWLRVVDQLMPAAAELALSLSDKQIARVQKRFDEGNKRFTDEYAKRDPRAREEADYKRLVSRSEWLYGTLDDGQTALLSKVAKTPSFDVDVVLAERRLRQAELARIVTDARAAAKTRARDEVLGGLRTSLRAWSEHGLRSPRAEYRAYQKRMQDQACALSAQVHNAGGADARKAAQAKLEGWAADAKALAEVDPR